MSDGVKQSSLNAKALRHSLEEKRKAYELLNTSPIISPFVPTRVVLDKPFMIWGPPPTRDLPPFESNIVDAQFHQVQDRC